MEELNPLKMNIVESSKTLENQAEGMVNINESEYKAMDSEQYKLLDKYNDLYISRTKLSYFLEKKKSEREALQPQLNSQNMEEFKAKVLDAEAGIQYFESQLNDVDNQLSEILPKISEENKNKWLQSDYPPKTETTETIKQEDEYAAYYLSVTHPEKTGNSDSRREAGPSIEEFENLVSSFESSYSLAELHAIVDLDVKEADSHPLRFPAITDLKVIRASIDKIKKETDIESGKYDELYAKYKKLSHAVGILSGGKVDHTR